MRIHPVALMYTFEEILDYKVTVAVHEMHVQLYILLGLDPSKIPNEYLERYKSAYKALEIVGVLQ